MSGSEVLTPDPVAEMQAVAMPEGALYAHQRVDGTMEYAMSAAEVREKCPVIGRLAVEAPDLADTFLELAAIGQGVIQARQEEHALPQEARATKEKSQVAAERKRDLNNDILKKPQLAEPAPVQKPEVEKPLPVFSAILMAEKATGRIEAPAEMTGTTKSHREAPVNAEIITTPSKPEPSLDAQRQAAEVFIRQQPVNQEQQPVPIRPDKAVLPEAQESIVRESISVVLTVSEADAGEPVVSNAAEALEAPEAPAEEFSPEAETETTETDAHILPAVISEEETHDFSTITELPRSEILGVEEPLEVRFEPEVIDIYRELIEVTPEPTAQPDFEVFITTQPQSTEVVSLESIVEEAEQQPLEQTFVQLARLLAEPTLSVQEQDPIQRVLSIEGGLSESTEESQIELQTVLHDIAELLPVPRDGPREATERVQISPELTQKMLLLLRTLGYNRPKETLVSFVRLYGFEFLLQALRYLCQLSNPDNQQELYMRVATSDSNDDHMSLSTVLGNSVLRLLSTKPLVA